MKNFPTRLSKLIRILCWIVIGSAGWVAANLIVDPQMFSSKREEYAPIAALPIAIMGLTNLLCFFCYLAWVKNLNQHVRVTKSVTLRFSPFWSWFSFLVPILNTFRPYQVVKELWLILGADKSDRTLEFWWTLWVLSMFSSELLMRVEKLVGDQSEFFIFTSLLVPVSSGLSAYYTIELIKGFETRAGDREAPDIIKKLP